MRHFFSIILTYFVPTSKLRVDNFFGYIAGVCWGVGSLFFVAANYDIGFMPKVEKLKYLTVSGTWFILTGSVWLACGVVLDKKSMATIDKKINWKKIELLPTKNNFHGNDCCDHESSSKSEFSFRKLISSIKNFFGLKQPYVDREVFFLKKKMKELELLLKQREIWEKRTDQKIMLFDEKFDAIGSAVVDAARNVKMGVLYMIFGTILLMPEIFHDAINSEKSRHGSEGNITIKGNDPTSNPHQYEKSCRARKGPPGPEDC